MENSSPRYWFLPRTSKEYFWTDQKVVQAAATMAQGGLVPRYRTSGDIWGTANGLTNPANGNTDPATSGPVDPNTPYSWIHSVKKLSQPTALTDTTSSWLRNSSTLVRPTAPNPLTDSILVRPCNGLVCLDYANETTYNLTKLDDSLTPERNWQVLLLLLVVCAGIAGNVLVCIAVCMEKKLQNVTNYFLMSLAIADLFVSLIVMPSSIVNEFMGFWPFDLIMCDLWQVADVMMCTSSIMHMCTISMDRYIGIRNPLKNRNKSRTIVGIKIAIVWLISLAIASPIILLSALDPANVLANRTCAIFNTYFLIYGSLAAFFIPLVIMLVAYTLTIYRLNKQAKLCAQKNKDGPVMRRSTSVKRRGGNVDQPATNGINLNSSKKMTTQTTDRAKAHPSETEPLQYDNFSLDATSLASNSPQTPRFSASLRSTLSCQTVESENSDDGQKTQGALKLQALVRKHQFAIKAASWLLQRRDNLERKELQTVQTERKAVKVLGTVFAIFVMCWAPFFTLNFAMGFCETCDIDIIVFKVFLWLGYISSTLNPIIYTIFNKTFRQAFIKILLCRFIPHKGKIHRSSTFTTTNGNSIKIKYNGSLKSTIPEAYDETVV